MIVSERVQERMDAAGLSQSELARRVGVSQPTIYKLLRRSKKGSTHLHRIARELGTSPGYLTGETDDPEENAPLPPLRPASQSVLLPVSLPSEDALAAAFRGLLIASRRMNEDELARELATRLPTLLRVAASAIVDQGMVDDFAAAVDLPAPDAAGFERQRA